MLKKPALSLYLLALSMLATPQMAYAADLKNVMNRTMMQLQQLLPFAAMVALVIAAYYFFMGEGDARQRVGRIAVGIFIGLAAVHIVGFLQGMVR